MRRLLAALPVLALMTGCAALKPAADAPSLDGTAWVLSDIPGRNLETGAPATLRFEGGRATGSDGCNRYSVNYTSKGSALEFPGRAPSTLMACPSRVMEQADAFMAALAAVRSYRIDSGRLHLLSADGTVRATLAAQSHSLAGTNWRVTAINNGRGGVASVVADSTVTLAFAAHGKASGTAGCNRFTAGYQAQGARVRFSAPASTRMMCPGQELMAQEQAFLKALESASTMRIEADRLELRSAEGALLVSATRLDGG